MARRDPSDPQVFGCVPSQLEHLCSATLSEKEHGFLINCSSTKNNLSSQILEDGSAVDGRSASNPPQPFLVFHLKLLSRQNIMCSPHRAILLAHFLLVAENGHLLQLAMDPEFRI